MYSSAYVWAKVLHYLEEHLTSVSVTSWFDDAEVLALTDDHLIIYSPSDFRRDIIQKRCTSYIEDAMKEIFDSDVKLLVYGDKEKKERENEKKIDPGRPFNPQFTFDNFVVGPSNRFAYSASIAVSNNPGNVYNPLFIYGPSGLGKTHLLYSIANVVRKNNKNAEIVYIKGDEFTNELITAIQNGKNAEFRNRFRKNDLLLIDDIQFIAGKPQTQQEFFHTFNALYEEHKQIVMTSDRKPSDMATLEDRLRTRFEWGLLADIQPPDYETRMAILKNKSKVMGIDLPDDVCSYIATNITDNVRKIEGVIKKIMAYRDLDNMTVNITNVSRIIEDSFRPDTPSLPTPALIIAQVCRFYSVEESVLRGTLKKKNIAEARQIAMYLIRTLTNLSLPDIGKEFSDRDHTTVLYAIRKVETAVSGKDPAVTANLRDITANINSCL